MGGLRNFLKQSLAQLERQHLRRSIVVRDSAPLPYVSINGRRYISFCSNDYLGLSQHPKIIAALREGAKKWGVGATASHLVCGHTRAHTRFEEQLAKYLNCERTLLFSSGYLCNLGVVQALLNRGDTVVEDRLNHASLLDAAQLSRAKLFRYKHRDLSDCAARLEQSSGRCLLVTDGVFSMDGDLAPLPELVTLADEYEAWLMVDDAHAFGVLAGGQGSRAVFGLSADRVPIHVVTLGKALGVSGAAVAGSSELIEYLVQRARPYIYTTALPPALAEALSVALEILSSEPWRQSYLEELIKEFRVGAHCRHLDLLPSDTPIQPLVLGSAHRALYWSRRLRENGYWVPAIRPPTVPEGSARLRITLSSVHTKDQIENFLDALAELQDEMAEPHA